MKKNLTFFIPIPLLAFVFLVYWFTKPPSILWVDSGTMIAASYSLGIPNPPGFPFYVLFSHLFAILPIFNNVFTRLELFTIVFSLGLLFFVYKIILDLIQSDFFFHKHSAFLKGDERGQDQFFSKYLPYLASSFGTISLAFSYQYWSQSENTEAFIFTYFFIPLFIYLSIKLSLKKKELASAKINFHKYSSHVFRFLLLICFLYALSLGANPTIASFVPVVFYLIYLNRSVLDKKRLIILGLTFLFTFSLVYSFLPIRAKAYPFLNWGNPQTPSLFLGHLRGEGLNIYEPDGIINGFTGSPEVFLQSVSYFFLLALIQFTPLLFPFIASGIYFVFKKNKYLLLLLLIVPVVDMVYGGLYYSGNQESWFILAWLFGGIFAGLGFYYIVRYCHLSVKKTWIVFLLCLVPLVFWFIPLNRSKHFYASDYTQNLYSHLDKNAILIGTGDFFNSLSFYLREAEGFRRDITPITINVFYVNKWHRDSLRHSTDLVLSNKIEDIIQHKSFSEFNDSVNELIAENISKHPIYVTHLSLRASAIAATNAGQLKIDEKRFKFIPNGLTLKVVRVEDKTEPDLDAFDFKFNSPLSKKPFYIEKNYKGGINNLLNEYVYSFVSLGDWYADKKDYEKALFYYKKAEGFSKDNPEILSHLGTLYANKGDYNASSQYNERALFLDYANAPIHFNLGISLLNLNRAQDAMREFELAKLYAPRGDPIIADSDNMLRQIQGVSQMNKDGTDGNWEEVGDQENNLIIKIPPFFEKDKIPDSSMLVISKKTQGKEDLTIYGLGSRLKKDESVESFIGKSRFKNLGKLIDEREIKIPCCQAKVQIFGDENGKTTELFILRKNDWVWLFRAYPGDSSDLSYFYDMLGTFRPYQEK